MHRPRFAPFVAIAAVAAALQPAAGCGLDRFGEGPAIGGPDGGELEASGADSSGGSSGSSSGGPSDATADHGGGGDSAADAPAIPDAPGDGGPGADVEEASGDEGSGDDAGGNDASPVVAPPEFAWYKLDEASGSTAHDSTAHGYDIKLSQVTWGSGANFSLPGGASQSGGSVAVDPGVRQPPISFTAWLAPNARSDETSNSYAITPFPPDAVSGDTPGAYGFGIGVNAWTDGTPGGALAVENVGYDFTSGGGAPFAAGVEYFVAVAIGPTTATVYVDGDLVASSKVTVPAATPGATLRLGYHNEDTGYGTKRFYTGRMRDVRVFKRVLTAGEVATLWNDGPSP